MVCNRELLTARDRTGDYKPKQAMNKPTVQTHQMLICNCGKSNEICYHGEMCMV
jgi:hypothetical protein